MDDPPVTEKKPFAKLEQPLIKVLREQLGPGELDAAARVCKAWAAQLAHDVVHCEMAMPGCYEQLLCQLEQLGKRFRNVHSWHFWPPAGSDWSTIDELRLLWLLSRYKTEKLQLDGRLYWDQQEHPRLPELDSDVMPWMSSLRSLQNLNLSHCTLARPDGLKYLAFPPDLRTLTLGLKPESNESWLSSGLEPYIEHLCRLKQVAEIELHLEGVSYLQLGLPGQVRRVFAGCVRLQRFKIMLGTGWGLVRDSECVVFERVPSPDKQADWLDQPVGAAAAASNLAAAAPNAAAQQQRQQQRRRNWLAMMDPAAARAAAAAGLDLSLYDLPDQPQPQPGSSGLHNPPNGLHNPPDGLHNLVDDDSDDDSFWAAPAPAEPAARGITSSAGVGQGPRGLAAAFADEAWGRLHNQITGGLGNQQPRELHDPAQQQQQQQRRLLFDNHGPSQIQQPDAAAGAAAAAAAGTGHLGRGGIAGRLLGRWRDRSRYWEMMPRFGALRGGVAGPDIAAPGQQQQQGLGQPPAAAGAGSSQAAAAAAAAADLSNGFDAGVLEALCVEPYPERGDVPPDIALFPLPPPAAAAAAAAAGTQTAAVDSHLLTTAAAAATAASDSPPGAQQAKRRKPESAAAESTPAAAAAAAANPPPAAAAGLPVAVQAGPAAAAAVPSGGQQPTATAAAAAAADGNSPSASITMRMKRALLLSRGSSSPSSSDGEQQQQQGVRRMVIQRSRYGSSPRRQKRANAGSSSYVGAAAMLGSSLSQQQQQQQQIADITAAEAVEHALFDISEMEAFQQQQQQRQQQGHEKVSRQLAAAAAGAGPQSDGGSSSSSGESDTVSDDRMSLDDSPAAAAAAADVAASQQGSAAAAARPAPAAMVYVGRSATTPSVRPHHQQQQGGSSSGHARLNLPMPLNLLDRELGHAAVAPAAAAAAATAATSLSPLQILDRELGHAGAAAATATAAGGSSQPAPSRNPPAAAAATPSAAAAVVGYDSSTDRPGYVPTAAAAAAAEYASQLRITAREEARAAAAAAAENGSSSSRVTVRARSPRAAYQPAAAVGDQATRDPYRDIYERRTRLLRYVHLQRQLAAAAAAPAPAQRCQIHRRLEHLEHNLANFDRRDPPDLMEDHMMEYLARDLLDRSDLDHDGDLSDLDSEDLVLGLGLDGLGAAPAAPNAAAVNGAPVAAAAAQPGAAAAAAAVGLGRPYMARRGAGVFMGPAATAALAGNHTGVAAPQLQQQQQPLLLLPPPLPAAAAPLPAPAPIAAPAPAAAAAAAAVPPLRVPQLNRCVVNPDSLLITQLKMQGITGPAALLYRLQQLLAGSPAIALQHLELHFSAAAAAAAAPPPAPAAAAAAPAAAAAAPASAWSNGLAVVGGGRVVQLLLRQMLLLQELRISGIRSCEASDDAPHFWRAIGELRGLTKLCFDSSSSSRFSSAAPADVDAGPQPEPAAAHMVHKLQLDALFMQVLVCRLQELQALEFCGDIPQTQNPDTSASFPTNPSLHPSSSSSVPLAAAAAAYGNDSSTKLRIDPNTPALSLLNRLPNLMALRLEHQASSPNFGLHNKLDPQLDLAWLPAGLTQLKLRHVNLSCHGVQHMTDNAAAGYAVLLLQQRRANTPDAFVAAAAAADVKGKSAMKIAQGHSGSSSSSSSSGYRHHVPQPPVPPIRLHNLAELSLADCAGVQTAVIGCLAHSTGIKTLELICQIKPPPLWLGSIAWMWPRLRDVSLCDQSGSSSKKYRAAAVAAARSADVQGCGTAAGSSTAAAAASTLQPQGLVMPDLLGPSVTPELAAAWLWRSTVPSGSSSGSSGPGGGGSSSSAISVAARLIQDIHSRGSSSSSATWADAQGLATFASGLANLCKLKLLLPRGSSGSSSSSSRFGSQDLLGLSSAQRLRELTVELPNQQGYKTAAEGLRQLTKLNRLRLLDVKCGISRPNALEALGVQTPGAFLVDAAARHQQRPIIGHRWGTAAPGGGGDVAAAGAAADGAAQPAAPAAAAAQSAAAAAAPASGTGGLIRLLNLMDPPRAPAAAAAAAAAAANAAPAAAEAGQAARNFNRAMQRPPPPAHASGVQALANTTAPNAGDPINGMVPLAAAAAAAAAAAQGHSMRIEDLLAQPNAMAGGLGSLLRMRPALRPAAAAATGASTAAAAAAGPPAYQAPPVAAAPVGLARPYLGGRGTGVAPGRGIAAGRGRGRMAAAAAAASWQPAPPAAGPAAAAAAATPPPAPANPTAANAGAPAPAAAAALPAAAAANPWAGGGIGGLWGYDPEVDDDELYEYETQSDTEDEAAAALQREVAAAVGGDPAAEQPPPAVAAAAAGQQGAPPAAGAAAAAAAAGQPAAAAAAGDNRRRRRRHLPSELLDEMRRDMPATSVFLHITRS